MHAQTRYDLAEVGLEPLLGRARALIEQGGRSVLGITGPPGAGKSTLARCLIVELGADAVGVPMDGFHLAQAELDRLGRADRKGAADTFDAAGYVHLLCRLREHRAGGEPDETVYAPEFHREFEEPVAGSIAVGPAVPLVVTEGNYLLLDDPPWRRIKALCDEVWYLRPDEELRMARLVARHIAYGHDEAWARERTGGSDQRNAERVAATMWRADVVLTGSLPAEQVEPRPPTLP